MTETTSIIGKDGTPIVTQTGHAGHGNYGYGHNLENLITQNTINAGAASNLDATHRNTSNVLNAVADAARDNIRETSRAGSDNTRETARAGSDNIRETARVGSDISHDISESRSGLSRDIAELRSAIERTGGESRLSTAIASGEGRELTNKVGTDNLIAIKENGFTIREQACMTREKVLEEAYRTREKAAEQFASLQLQNCKEHADLKQGQATLTAKLDGLKDSICCCVKEAAAESTIERLKSEVLNSKFAALSKDKPGNS